MIKLANQIQGIVISVGAIAPASRNSHYFKQVVILHQPEELYKGQTIHEEFFVIHIISTSERDSRFLKPEDKGTVKKPTVYLKGERWASGNRGDYNYTHKLNLTEWQP
jgi:hypothetical protein